MLNQKFIIAILFITLLCVELGQGISCYQHDNCVGGCPTLASSVVQCESSQSKCWKMTSLLGTKRGCGDNRCMIQLDTGFIGAASVCCSGNLCNSAIQMKTSTMAVIFTGLITFLYTWCI